MDAADELANGLGGDFHGGAVGGTRIDEERSDPCGGCQGRCKKKDLVKTVEAVLKTANVALDVLTKLWQSSVIAFYSTWWDCFAVPRAKSEDWSVVCHVEVGANRGHICGHVGLPATTFNTPSQTKGPIILVRTP